MDPDIAPLAQRLAEENNVDWRSLEGTGENGRIVERDVLDYLARVMAGEEAVDPTPEPLPEGVDAWVDEEGNPIEAPGAAPGDAAPAAAGEAPPAAASEAPSSADADEDLLLAGDDLLVEGAPDAAVDASAAEAAPDLFETDAAAPASDEVPDLFEPDAEPAGADDRGGFDFGGLPGASVASNDAGEPAPSAMEEIDDDLGGYAFDLETPAAAGVEADAADAALDLDLSGDTGDEASAEPTEVPDVSFGATDVPADAVSGPSEPDVLPAPATPDAGMPPRPEPETAPEPELEPEHEPESESAYEPAAAADTARASAPAPAGLAAAEAAWPLARVRTVVRRHVDLAGLWSLQRSAALESGREHVPTAAVLLLAARKAAGRLDVEAPGVALPGGANGVRLVVPRGLGLAEIAAEVDAVARGEPAADDDADLWIADLSGLGVDEAVLDATAPQLTLGRVMSDEEDGSLHGTLALASDHDVEHAAAFLARVADLIEDPLRLLA